MVDDIRQWLEGLGLGKHAGAFEEHEIGGDVVAFLTDDHLKELGIPLGNRLRLLKAISAEAGNAIEPVAVPTAIPTKSPPAITASVPSSDAERRPLTVMFCDLADSTALSKRLDPEDLQDVIRAYQETSTRHIQEYEGFVAKYMGDGILVYFGYPKALERDAERAVRSALNIIKSMEELNRTLGREKDVEIAVRVGIATSIVMVGEIVGEGMAQERTVVGEAPNLAARLQGLADRNRIVVGDSTRELCGDVFDYEDLGANQLKGIDDLVQCWGVTGLRDDTVQALDRDRDNPPSPLVGRDEEIGLLRRAWQNTKDEGRGLIVTLTGEAGIGKSSLIDWLKAKVRTEGLPQLTMRCSPYHANSTLYPVIEHFKRLARWHAEDDAPTRLDKLERMLGRYSQPLSEAVPLMASLLSLTVPEDRYPLPDLTPQQHKQQTQDMIIGITMEIAESRPFLQLWEDLHWADPSTLELIGLLIEQAPTTSLLMVLTARPEFQPPWPARSHITPITLNRLERPHAEALVAGITWAKPLPSEVVDHIVAKTDGVPLYVEELTKTILVSEIVRDTGEHLELTGALSSLAIPETLQGSLMARLDRLPQVRELAQLGAVLGREFAYEMILGLAAVDETALREGLGQLVEAELLYQRGRPPRATYIFKHALIQDAAYGSLLRRTRQQYHQAVAKLLEGKFPEVVEAQPELVAHHYSEANVASRAVDYLQKAGARASRMSADPEAVAHLTKGLELLRAMPDSAKHAGRELNLLTTLGPALIVTKGYPAPVVEATYHRALELCQALGDAPRQFSALRGLWFIHLHRGEYNAACGLAEQMVEVAGGSDDSGLELIMAHQSLGYTLQFLGELEASQSQLDRAVTLYDPVLHSAYAFRHGGADPAVGALCQGARAVWALGYPDQALRQNQDGIALARQIAHPYSEAWALHSMGCLHQCRGELGAARAHADAAIEIAKERGFVSWSSRANIIRSWARVEQGGGAEAIADLRNGIDEFRATGAVLGEPYWLALLAGAHSRLGQAQEGLAAIAEALTLVDRTGERFYEADLHRLRGELLFQSNAANVKEAENCFHQAIEIARSQAAKSWELRAATSLARLWQQRNRQKEAHGLLAQVYDWFTEGFDSADLIDAKALLNKLG